MIRTLVVLCLVSVLLWTYSGTREHVVGSSSGTETAPAPAPATAPSTAPAPPLSTPTVPPEFQRLLDVFKTSYLEYKMTGTPASRTAYENAQRLLDTQLTTLRTRSDTTATNIQKFVDEYVKANPEVVSLTSQLKTIQREAPILQNRYETEQRTSEAITTVDISMYYLKGFVTLASLSIVGIIAMTQ